MSKPTCWDKRWRSFGPCAEGGRPSEEPGANPESHDALSAVTAQIQPLTRCLLSGPSRDTHVYLHVCYRATPCCLDQRGRTSAVKSVLTEVRVRVTAPPIAPHVHYTMVLQFTKQWLAQLHDTLIWSGVMSWGLFKSQMPISPGSPGEMSSVRMKSDLQVPHFT